MTLGVKSLHHFLCSHMFCQHHYKYKHKPVSDVSAMFVATMHFLTPSGAFWKIFACRSEGSWEYIGKIASWGAFSNSPSLSLLTKKHKNHCDIHQRDTVQMNVQFETIGLICWFQNYFMLLGIMADVDVEVTQSYQAANVYFTFHSVLVLTMEMIQKW